MEGGGAHERVEQQEAETAPAVARAPANLQAPLLRGTSNAAIAAWLARDPAPGATTAPPDKAQMEALEKKMVELKEQAGARVKLLAAVNDDTLQALKNASKHLQQSNENYKAAHKLFTDKLAEADERFEMEQAIIDSVQGILVAAALAVIGPEMLVVGGAVRGLEAAAAKHAEKLVSYGFKAGAKALEGGAGEIAEQGAGKGVSGAKGDAVKPGSTAAGGGATSGDKYEEAFNKLNDMIAALPKLGKTIAATSDVSGAAGDVALEAVRLSGGGSGKWTAAEATEKGNGVAEVNGMTAADLMTARLMANNVVGMSNQVVNVPIKEIGEIENLIWTNWMASLEGSKNEVLDNDKIQDYLEAKGMLSPGSYMSDADQADAVTGARKKYLKNKGIELAENAAVDSLYRREMKLEELNRRLLGKHGRVTDTDKVTVDGIVYSSPGMCGGKVGDEVVISFVRVKPHMLGQSINVAVWDDGEYDIMGNTADAIANAGRG